MAYSMFECPKLHYVKSMKFFPEEYDHHVSFRHKNLPQNFELTTAENNNSNNTTPPHPPCLNKYKRCDDEKKCCPIYVHNFHKIDHNLYNGDCLNKTKRKLTRNKQTVLEKLEESYWANWKPDNKHPDRFVKKSKSPDCYAEKKSPDIQVIKSAPTRKVKIPPPPEDTIESQIESDNKNSINKSREIQTEITAIASRCSSEENVKCDADQTNFLKHTDSFILNSKKQKEEKEHFEQPRCIRLYRKPGKMTSKNFVKGGSYPLKSCLKKESNFNKGNIRLGRPGSPVIVTSNYSSRSNRGHKR